MNDRRHEDLRHKDLRHDDLRRNDLRHTDRRPTAPPLRRGWMTPVPWLGAVAACRAALRDAWRGERARAAPLEAAWAGAARRRRTALLVAIGLVTATATALLVGDGGIDDPLAVAHTALAALLFAWVGAGCFTAVAGGWALWRGDRHALQAPPAGTPIDPAARTAIVMPICNEDIATVFGGLQATCASLAATGAQRLFDVFVLSDTADPVLRAAELRAWQALRDTLGDTLGGGARVHYRWRRRRTKRKAGNVADFCRRWGNAYRYMVVLDADSTMSGDCVVSLVRLMEAHPRAGIVQTLPCASGHTSLHARAQQFLGRVTGRVFAAGLAWWQLGESHYWGHNAILRVEPFMRHCALAPIPGRGGLAGEILSHDFVEAALMRRAGWGVWLVDLPGSWEQAPPHLVDELQRDRRWCQGNLQNARLMAEPGFAPVHRTMLACGAFAYLASPLWLAFVVLGTLRAAAGALPATALALWTLTLALLLLPRALGVLVVLRRGEQRAFGGTARLVAGAVGEAALATVQAPVRMLAHTGFVLGALTGLRLEWRSPSRDAAHVGWGEAARRFGIAGAFAALGIAIVAAGGAAVSARPALVPLWPLVLPLLVAVPLAVWTSRAAPGLRRLGLWLTPEERRPPAALTLRWPRPVAVAVTATLPAPVAAPAPAATPAARPVPAASPALASTPPPRRAATRASSLSLWTGRAVATAVLVGVPVLSLPRADGGAVAFAYQAALPAPYDAPVVVAASDDRPLKTSGSGKRKRRAPPTT